MEKKKLLKQKTRTSFDFVNLPGEKLTYAPQINEAVEFDQPNIIENQENKDKTIYYPSLSSVIALNGVQAIAAGDLKYANNLLRKAAELASITSVCTFDLIKACNSDGFNMFHAAVIYKRMDMIHMIIEHGAEIVSVSTEDEHQDTPLILAIKYFAYFVDPDNLAKEGYTNLDVVTSLIKNGADVNTTNKKGNTPLIYAVKYQLPSVIEVLINTNNFNSINACNDSGNTALCYAAAFDNKEIAERLLSLNADLFAADKTGDMAIHTACKCGSEKVLLLLLSKDQDKRLVHAADANGNTPLMLAKSASVYSPNNIRLLISRGSNLMAFNHDHNRILHLYGSTDDKDINEDILQKEPSLLSHKNYDLETPLHVAAKYGHATTCFYYCEKGADIYAKNAGGFTPMMTAIVHQHKEVVKVFFAFNYRVDDVVKQGKTLLEWAIEHGHIALIEALSESDYTGVFTNYYNGSCLIHYVCKVGNIPILQYLLNWDNYDEFLTTTTQLDSPLGNGYYPIHVVVKNDHLECVQLLHKYGYDLKTRTVEGQDTPLHIAARDGHFQMVKYLLSQGIDPEAINYTEGTALSSAACTGRYNIVAYLLSISVCVDGNPERCRTTPLLLACKEGHDTVVKLLLEYSVDVTIANEEGHNCLTEAILRGHSRTALTILSSKHWRKALQFRTLKNETPMRLLIQHMPDVAELALYRCVHREYKMNNKGSNEVTKIEYSYEFLDDYITPQPTLAKFVQDKVGLSANQTSIFENSAIFNTAQDIPLVSLPNDVLGSSHLANTLKESTNIKEDMDDAEEYNEDWWLQEMYDPENHPLELMVNYKRTSLLMSPVVEEMRKRKWKKFGLPAFICNLIVYSLFLVMLTAVVLVTPFPQSDMCSGCWSSWNPWRSCKSVSECVNLSGTRSRTRNCTTGCGDHYFYCQGLDIESEVCRVKESFLEVQSYPMDQIAEDGGNATFYCAITGNSSTSIHIMWYNEHGLLNHDRDSNVLIDTKRNGNTFSSNLTLIEVSCEDAQMYTCNGSNGIDTVTASAMLTISQKCRSDCRRSCREKGLSSTAESFLITADVIIIVFSIMQLLLELLQIWKRKLKYIADFENWLENGIFILSVVFAVSHLKLESDCFCPDKFTWTVGILAVFFGWNNHVYFLRRLPYTGITISIMYNIFITFVKLLLIAALLIFAFALPFFMLLTVPHRRTPFSTIGRSMLKTLVMLTGEFEFDTIFINDQDLVDEGVTLFLPGLTAIIWVLFIILMPIIFGNLLVGLAVGDTQEEQAKAQLTRISLQVRLILELENTMSVLRYYARSTGITFTRDQSWYSLGQIKLEQKEAQLVAWEQRANFKKVQELLKADPVYEFQQSLNQQVEAVTNLHATFIKRIDHLEDQLSSYFRSLERNKESNSETEFSMLHKWKSRVSLDTLASSSSSTML